MNLNFLKKVATEERLSNQTIFQKYPQLPLIELTALSEDKQNDKVSVGNRIEFSNRVVEVLKLQERRYVLITNNYILPGSVEQHLVIAAFADQYVTSGDNKKIRLSHVSTAKSIISSESYNIILNYCGMISPEFPNIKEDRYFMLEPMPEIAGECYKIVPFVEPIFNKSEDMPIEMLDNSNELIAQP